MDNFTPMLCQSCGDKLQPTAYHNHYRCPSCGNEYLTDKQGGELVRTDQPPQADSSPRSQGTVGYISAADAYVTSLKLFSSGSQAVPTKERQYQTRFRSNTDYIYWELNLDHPAVDKTVDFVVFVIWHYPDGKTYSNSMKIEVEADWSWSRWWNRTAERHTQGQNWMLGDYQLDFFVEGKQVTSGAFTIYE